MGCGLKENSNLFKSACRTPHAARRTPHAARR
jgi:hypothetical protein